MRYESKPIFHVDLSPKYHYADRILHVDKNYNDHLDQEKLLELRLSAANGSRLINNCNVIIPDDEHPMLNFGIESQTIDMDHPYNKNQLRDDYRIYVHDTEFWNDAMLHRNLTDKLKKTQSFDAFVQSHNKLTVGITTKQIGQSNVLVTLFDPEYLSKYLGVKLVNIFEAFDFENLKVNLTIVVETYEALTEEGLMSLSEEFNGQMSDGWGETYGIDKVDEFHDVSGWMFSDDLKNIFVPSKHQMFYPQS